MDGTIMHLSRATAAAAAALAAVLPVAGVSPACRATDHGRLVVTGALQEILIQSSRPAANQ